MTVQVNDHFHLFFDAVPSGETTASEWKGYAPNAQPQDLPDLYMFAAPARSEDGTLHPHLLTNSGGGPKVFRDWTLLVYCSEWNDLDTWETYLGQVMYFVPHHHDPLSHGASSQRVFVYQYGKIQAENYQYQFITLPVQMVDARDA